MKTILFYVKEVYGKPMRYLADKDQALSFMMLTGGKKTISDDQYQAFLNFGLTLQEITRSNPKHPDFVEIKQEEPVVV